MRTTIKRIAAVLCIVGIVCMINSCTQSDFLSEENSYEISAATRGDGESPYYFYDHENNKVYLSLNTAHAFYSVEEFSVPIQPLAGITSYGIRASEFNSDMATARPYKGGVAVNRVYTELSLQKQESDEQYLTLLSDIKKQNKEAIVAPYFNDRQGNKIGLSNFFYVKLKNTVDTSVLEQMAEQVACEIVNQDEFMPLWYKLSVTGSAGLNALECANLFHESGKFAAAEPDLMADFILSNDTYFSQQWGLAKVGVNDVMWRFSTGRNVKVAVIDHGIDLTHPDLAANLHPLSYDCESGTTPQRIRGNHGTAVAGIIGAVTHNALGIAGVAPDCKLMSISHSLVSGTSSRQQLASGINWAWQNGADVINCSWGHATALTGSYITDAMTNAVNSGRGGKGCVIIAASGNSNTSIAYPASLYSVIAVGAIGTNSKRASFSNYGSSLSVVAPGDAIYTTDRQGSAGYNGASGTAGDYYSAFDGTSAAAPFVSGIAAMVLAEYPELTQKKMKEVIEKSGTWLSGYTYRERENGEFNDEVGYGLVNAYYAMEEGKTEDFRRTPAIDFKLVNNSDQLLQNVRIKLTGKIGGNDITLISQTIDRYVERDETIEGFPNYPGNALNAAPGTAITNLRLELSSDYHAPGVPVTLHIDYISRLYHTVNFYNGLVHSFYIYNTSVPTEGRRTLYIILGDER